MLSNTKLFSNIERGNVEVNENTASYKGITIKTMISLVLAIASAIVVGIFFRSIFNGDLSDSEISVKLGQLGTMLIFSSIVGFISVLIGRMRVGAAKYCAIIYAICEGIFVGTISMMGEMYSPGIVLSAVIATIVAFIAMLVLFASGVIRNRSRFSSFVISYGFSLIMVSLCTMLLGVFIPTLRNSFWFCFMIEAAFLVYGCFMLLLNFDECTTLVKSGCKKEYEWSAAFGLLITILYIYVEILRVVMLFSRKE